MCYETRPGKTGWIDGAEGRREAARLGWALARVFRDLGRF
jgi:hypothetical protein